MKAQEADNLLDCIRALQVTMNTIGLRSPVIHAVISSRAQREQFDPARTVEEAALGLQLLQRQLEETQSLLTQHLSRQSPPVIILGNSVHTQRKV